MFEHLQATGTELPNFCLSVDRKQTALVGHVLPPVTAFTTGIQGMKDIVLLFGQHTFGPRGMDTSVLPREGELTSGSIVGHQFIEETGPFLSWLETAAHPLWPFGTVSHVPESDPLSEARRKARLFVHKSVSTQVLNLLGKIETGLRELDAQDLPELVASELEDGSVLLEWFLKDRRVVFGVEKDPKESGWILVTGESSGRINASGHFGDTDFNKLIPMLLTLRT